jgi:surface repeat SSSPR-51 protein
VSKSMKKTFKITGATAGTVLVALSQISPAFADEVAKNTVEVKSTELDKQVEEFKKLGIEPTVEKQVIKKTVKSQDELAKARQEIEDKIHQADKANQSALDTTKTHKENVKKEGERLKTEEDEIKAQFPLIFEKDGVRVYGKFNEAGKGSQDYYKDIHVFFDVDSDYEGAVDGVHVYEDSKFEILKGPAEFLGKTNPQYPNMETIGLGEKNQLPAEGTSIKLTHVANLDDGRQVDMIITVGKFRTKSDDKPEFLKEFLSALGRGEDGANYLTIEKTTTGNKQIGINSAFGKQTQLDIQFVDTDGKPVKLVTGLVSTDVDWYQSVTVAGNAFLGNIVAPKEESKLETITWDADGVEVPNTIQDTSGEGSNDASSIPQGSFVSVLAGDSFSYTHGEWRTGLTQGDAYREDYMKKAKNPELQAGMGAYMYAEIFGIGSKVNVHKPNIPTQPETTLVEVVGEIEVINHTTYVEDKTGKELSPKDEGIKEKKDIPEYEYVRTDKKENGDVEHVYRKSVTTTYVDENGNKLLPPEKGEKDKKDIPGYKFIETKKKENGDIEHVYKKVSKITTYVDESGKELLKPKEGTHEKEVINGYEFVKTNIKENGDVEHVYKQVSKITTYVDESGKELLPKKEGIHEKEKINGYEYVKTITKDNGDVEHVYKKVAEKKLPATSLGIAGGIASVLGLTGVGAYFNSRKRKK